MAYKKLHIQLGKDQAEQLNLIAALTNTSVSEVLRQLIDTNQEQLRRATKQKHGIFQK